MNIPEIIPYEQATKKLTPIEKVGQSFMPAAYINDSEESIRQLESLIKKHAIGGICFFHSRASAATNFEGEKEVIYNDKSLDVLKRLIDRYQKAAPYPLLISIDAEWGLAMRIENSPQYPYAIALGAMQDGKELIYQVGQKIGMDCREAGIHWNFAPVADVNNNPENPVIGYRSFGEDPEHVSGCALAFNQGLQSSGVLSSAKHFPGHGDTATDSHLGIPLIDKSRDQLFQNELVPFIDLIDDGVDSVMIGHLMVPSLNGNSAEAASVSKKVITDFLRKELGFEGVVVSDALNMHAVSKTFPNKGELEYTAYTSGTDVLCYAEHVEEGISTIAARCTAKEIEAHFRRVWRLKEKAYANQHTNSTTPTEDHSALMKRLAKKSLSNYKGRDKLKGDFIENGFASLALPLGRPSEFLSTIHEHAGPHCQLLSPVDPDRVASIIPGHERILVALYPPRIKPAGNFGIDDKTLDSLKILAKKRELILYLFGNPYVLNILDKGIFEGIWIAFQDFPEFELNAARQFLGEVTASGKIPVSIKSMHS